ncbi:MAG: hypothetical protein AB2L14_36590 [Candidatus Xenobiia bacterium LiM19]
MTPFKTIQNLSAEVAESYCPAGNADTKWHTSGIINFNAPFNRFTLGRELPLITEGADEQVGRRRSQHIDRNAAAILLDWNLRRLSQGKAVIDLRLGELLVEFRKRQPQKLGFVRLPDYTREEMGIPWRSASLLVSNWTALEKLPLLKQAHREGLISKSKLRSLLRVTTAENEEAWIEKASKVSVRTLEELVKAEEARRNGGGSKISDANVGGSALDGADAGNSGSDTESVPDGRASEPDGKIVPAACNLSSCSEDDRAGYLMSLITTPEKAAIWDSALEHFSGHEGGDFSTETFIEALLAEFCSALPLPADCTFSDAAGSVDDETGTDVDGSVDSGPAAEITAAHSNPSDTTAEHPYYSDAVSRHFNPQTPLDSAQAAIDTPLPQSRHWRRITGDEDGEFLSCDSCNGREADEERERWMMVRKDLEEVTKIWEYLSWTPVTVETPLEWDDALIDIRAVADMIKKIVAMRQLVGFYMGRILRTVENLRLYTDMQFASFNHYVVERLGISMRTARNLIKLVRSFLSLPILEGAFKDGVLTQQRAHLLLKVATEKTEAEWLKYGTEVPVIDLEREVKRLSRLIEADHNLLDEYPVLPGFSPPEKTKTEAVSGIEAQKAEFGPSGTVDKISSAPVQMCASDMLPDEADPGATGSSRKMCASDNLPAASCQYDDDDGPWKVVLRKETVDMNDPSELESWQMIMSGKLDCEDIEAAQDKESGSGDDSGSRQSSDSDSGSETDDEPQSAPANPATTDPAWKMCATDSDSVNITNDPVDIPVSSSISGFASGSSGDSTCCTDKGTAAICFFIPDNLIPLWNYAFIRYLEFADGSGTEPESPSSTDAAQNTTASDHTSTEIPPKASTLPSHSDSHSDGSGILLEGFLFSLIYHYLENEHKGLKRLKRRLRHKVIERDNFRCIVPGCSSRSGLDDHHITFRSQGGGDELPNNSSACFEHHRHCIHDNRYITIKGQAPDNLTVAMGVEPGRPPFALFINGRRICSNDTETGRN